MHACKLCLSLLLVEGESGCKAGWAGRAGRRVPVPHPGEMRWGLVPLVLAEDLGQVRTWEVTYLLCDTETWAVLPFELPHELHKVEKPQPHNFLYTLTELPPPPPPILSNNVISHQLGCWQPSPDTEPGQQNSIYFSGRMPGDAAKDLALLSRL